MLALHLDPDRLVQANNIAVNLASAFLASALLASGLMTWPILGGSAAAVIPEFVDVQLGSRARRHIPRGDLPHPRPGAVAPLFGVMFAAKP
jgi:uncharacterized membrane protein YfcA